MKTLFWAVYAILYDLIWDAPIAGRTASSAFDLLSGATEIVDVGCGTGLTSARLNQDGAWVVGVDESVSMLRRALARGRVSETVVAEASRISRPSFSADAAICANLLHLHPDPALVLDELVRLVRHGGLIAVLTPTQALSLPEARDADVRSGRGRVSSEIAHRARGLVGLLAQGAGVVVADGARVELAIRLASRRHGLEMRSMETIGWTQRLFVLQKPQSHNQGCVAHPVERA